MRKAIAASLLIAGASIAMPMLGHADTTTLPTDPVLGHESYVVTDANAGTVSVWENTNELAGLQTTDTIIYDADGNYVRTIPKDQQDL